MKKKFSKRDYATLSAFVRAYLHEDYVVEHATPEAALDAFRAVAAPEKVAALATELTAFLAAIESVPFTQAQNWWTHELGSAWFPSDKKQLIALQQRLSQK
ncbi:MAG: contact-dependent growth inhibition system immunity protein [Planctomycetota bacterium]